MKHDHHLLAVVILIERIVNNEQRKLFPISELASWSESGVLFLGTQNSFFRQSKEMIQTARNDLNSMVNRQLVFSKLLFERMRVRKFIPCDVKEEEKLVFVGSLP
jgi:hypothetical protein